MKFSIAFITLATLLAPTLAAPSAAALEVGVENIEADCRARLGKSHVTPAISTAMSINSCLGSRKY